MFSTGDVRLTKRRPRFMLCAAVVLFALIGHFIADGVCRSPDFSRVRPCRSALNVGAAGEERATSSLHSGCTLPTLIAFGPLSMLTFALTETPPISHRLYLPPPVPPPTISF
jgi:hypothetical protein